MQKVEMIEGRVQHSLHSAEHSSSSQIHGKSLLGYIFPPSLLSASNFAAAATAPYLPSVLRGTKIPPPPPSLH
jgi:hypothetical protein